MDPKHANPAEFPEEFKIEYIKVYQDRDLVGGPVGLQPPQSGTLGSDPLPSATQDIGGASTAINDILRERVETTLSLFTKGPIGHHVSLDFNPLEGAERDVNRISKS